MKSFVCRYRAWLVRFWWEHSPDHTIATFTTIDGGDYPKELYS